MNSPFAYDRPDLPVLTARNAAEAGNMIRDAVDKKRAVLARGGGTKWRAGQQPDGAAIILSTSALTGIIEYNPAELTITARAGTPLAEVEATLAANRQYLPFDPPFAAYGATLGGTVSAGLSGPRRMRYGGLRDFIIGIEYLDSTGQVIRSGGKVVKNAAGYDFSKLFCGSLGTLGVLTQVSFKVFPAPKGHLTALIGVDSAQAAQNALRAVARSTLEVSAADAWNADTGIATPPGDTPYTLVIQIDGEPESLKPRLDALCSFVPSGAPIQTMEGDQDNQLWERLRDLHWAESASTIARLYLPPNRLAALDTLLANQKVRRVYSVGGNAAWVALHADALSRLAPDLARLSVWASVWRSDVPLPEILPDQPGQSMVRRIKGAFDPSNVFYPGRYAG